jgi:serine/threonine-protein kinase 11
MDNVWLWFAHPRRREISLLKKLEHAHLIKLYDVLYNEEKQKLYMVMEYCIGGLQDMVDNAEGSRLPEWQAHSYVWEINTNWTLA